MPSCPGNGPQTLDTSPPTRLAVDNGLSSPLALFLLALSLVPELEISLQLLIPKAVEAVSRQIAERAAAMVVRKLQDAAKYRDLS